MRVFFLSFLFFFSLGGVFESNSISSPQPLPSPPTTFVLDEAKVLSLTTVDALQRLLKAQEQSTGDQVVFAIFKSLEGEDLVRWTNQIFHFWKIGKKGKDNGVLLAIYWKDHKARIEVGYGLEGKLTDAKSKRILAEVLAPGLKQNLPDQALTQSALEILKAIESPLIQNGQAAAILKGAKALKHSQPVRGSAHFVWLILSFFLALIFGRAFLYRGDRNFEQTRWRPSHPLAYRRRRGGTPLDGPGFGGLGGGPPSEPMGDRKSDDRDFSGGGGNSGGGGANQDW